MIKASTAVISAVVLFCFYHTKAQGVKQVSDTIPEKTWDGRSFYVSFGVKL
jgi:hypothetical protein